MKDYDRASGILVQTISGPGRMPGVMIICIIIMFIIIIATAGSNGHEKNSSEFYEMSNHEVVGHKFKEIP